MGVDLGQIEDKFRYALYLISKNMSKAKLNYTVTEKELLVVVHSLNKFTNYIIGYPTFIHTYHEPIKYLMNKPDINARISR